ncbi:MAG: type III secretion system chaperone [Parachlamydiales bacterium]|nr:type III secretion system chaperone [Parachlamydiales bacterium]
MIEQYISRLCQDLQMDIPQKSRDESYLLSVREDVPIAFSPIDEGFYAHARIAPAPEKKEDFYIYAMNANLLHQGTGAMILGLDHEDNFLTISLKIPYEIKYEEFKNYVEDFVNYFLYWKAEAESPKWKTVEL